jgi:hypothetical protein
MSKRCLYIECIFLKIVKISFVLQKFLLEMGPKVPTGLSIGQKTITDYSNIFLVGLPSPASSQRFMSKFYNRVCINL